MSVPPASPPRIPPRFVPTLTERVEAAPDPLEAKASAEPAPSHAAATQLDTPPLVWSQPHAPVPPAMLVATTTHPELTAQQQADTQFAARMAALRNKQRTALQTPPASTQQYVAGPVPTVRDNGVASPCTALPGWLPRSSDSQGENQHSASPLSEPPSSALEEALVERVLQRVDVVLEQRLCDAIASLVEAHSASLLPKLREEVESVVSRAVSEAFSAEQAAPRHSGWPQRY